MTKEYTIPTQTRIGHVHLKVSDLDRSLAFYCDLLGFELVTTYGDQAAFISAGGYHHHIGLNTWHSKGAGPAPINSAGLYHTAILYPTRKDLAFIFRRVSKQNIRSQGRRIMVFRKHYISMILIVTEWNYTGIDQRICGP